MQKMPGNHFLATAWHHFGHLCKDINKPWINATDVSLKEIFLLKLNSSLSAWHGYVGVFKHSSRVAMRRSTKALNTINSICWFFLQSCLHQPYLLLHSIWIVPSFPQEIKRIWVKANKLKGEKKLGSLQEPEMLDSDVMHCRNVHFVPELNFMYYRSVVRYSCPVF